jgi:hypothetical protein
MTRASTCATLLAQTRPTEPQSVEETRLCEAIDAASFHFSGSSVWQTKTHYDRLSVLIELLEARSGAPGHYEEADLDFKFLYSSLVHLAILLRIDDNVGPPDSLTELVRDLTREVGAACSIYLEQLKEKAFARPQDYASAQKEFVDEYTGSICNLIEDHIKTAFSVFADTDVESAAEIADKFVKIIHEPLHDTTARELENLFDDSQIGSLFAASQSPTHQQHEFWNRFTGNIGIFLSYESPLTVNMFRSRSSRSREVEWQEYSPDVVEDVLPDASDVTIDHVSSVTLNEDGSTCALCCEDSHKTMRKILVCGHEFGGKCLADQLSAKHPNRFRCACCRKPFFSDGRI